MLENHGVVTAGPSLQNAFERFETLEFTAKTVIKASLLGAVRYLDDEEAVHPRPPALATADADANRAVDERREGAAPAARRVRPPQLPAAAHDQHPGGLLGPARRRRVPDHAPPRRPQHARRRRPRPGPARAVRGGQVAELAPPAATRRSTSAIPTIQAIVNAYPVNATAFSVTAAPLDTRTIPESYIFLRDVGRVPFGVRFGDAAELAELTSPRDPILILDNDGVQVCGTSILDAFDRLEVLESTAEAMINSRPIGAMVPMSDQAIDELCAAFP